MSTKRKLLISIVSVVSALAIAAGVTLGVLQPWQGGEVLDTEPVPSGQVEVVEETEVELTNGDTGIMTMSARQIPVEEYEYYSIDTEDTLEHFEITPVLTVSESSGYGRTDASVSTDLIDIAYYTWTIDWVNYTGDMNVNNAQGSFTGNITEATSYDGTTKWYVADGWTSGEYTEANPGVSNFIKFTTKEMYKTGGGFNGKPTGSETPEEESVYDKEISGSTYTAPDSLKTDYTEGWTYNVGEAYTVGNTLAIPSVLAEIDNPFGTPIGLTLTVVDYGENVISASVRFDYMAKLTSDNFTVYSGVKGEDNTQLTEDSGNSYQVTLGDNGDSYQELFSAIYHEPWVDSLVKGDDETVGDAHDAYFEIASVNGIQLKEEKKDSVTGAPYWEDISGALDGKDQAVQENSNESTDSHPTTDVTYAYASYAVAAQSGASIFFKESDATWSTGTVYESTKTWSDWKMEISYTDESKTTHTHVTSMTINTEGADDEAMKTTTSWNGDDPVTKSITASIFNKTNNNEGITTLGTPVQGLRYSDLRTFDRSQTKGVLNNVTQKDVAAMITMKFYRKDSLVFTFSFSFNDYEMIRVDANTITLGNEDVTVGTSGGIVCGVVAGD